MGVVRLAELGDALLPPPQEAAHPAEINAPPGRAKLMAALRASVELGAAEEAPPCGPTQAHATTARAGPGTLPPPAAPPEPEVQPVNNAVPWHVDKSALPLSEPRRYRDRAHLEFVASQPCLLCGRRSSDAHHLRFMQPRTLGRKVSDEFAVPLCRTHHRTNLPTWTR
jgi:hypothetical protein